MSVSWNNPFILWSWIFSACVWQYVCDERRSLNSLQDWKRCLLTHAWHGWAFYYTNHSEYGGFIFFIFFFTCLNPSSTLLSVTVKSLGCSSDPELLSNKAAVRTGERTALCGVLSGCGAVVMLRSNGPACAAHTDAPAELINGAMSALVFSVFSVDRRLCTWPILYRDAFKLFRKI